MAGAGLAAIGVGTESPAMVAAATLAIALGFVCADLALLRDRQVGPITLYAVGAAVLSFADVVGFRAQYTDRRPLYFLYAVDEYLLMAALMSLAGLVLTVLGFWMIGRNRAVWGYLDLLPRVHGRIPDDMFVRWGGVLAATAVLVHAFVPLPSLGTLTSVIFLLPNLFVFALARIGAERRVLYALPIALAVALLESARAVWQSYLRIEMVFPLLAFVFGLMLGSRSLKALRRPVMLPIYILGAMFVMYFGAFGVVRTQAGGVQRILAAHEFEQAAALESEAVIQQQQQTVLSRLTTFNHLSQIGYLAERDGYLEGATLEYLGYAFIPRFIWPEKPRIAKGAWFALEIGQAHVRSDGSITNSVAMSIPGELYLNFGWVGVAIGCLLYGALLAVFWTRTDFWRDGRNALGSMFGFYLLWIGFGLGADLQIVVTVTAVYLVFVTAGIIWRTWIQGGRSVPLTASAPLRIRVQ